MSIDIADRLAKKDISLNKKSTTTKEKAFLSGKYVLLVFLLLFAIAPIYIMVVNSFKGATGVSQAQAWDLPSKLNFSTWGPMWDALKGSLSRTLFFVVQSSIISAIIGSINGYVFAKWRFKGSNLIFALFLFGILKHHQRGQLLEVHLEFRESLLRRVPLCNQTSAKLREVPLQTFHQLERSTNYFAKNLNANIQKFCLVQSLSILMLSPSSSAKKFPLQ